MRHSVVVVALLAASCCWVLIQTASSTSPTVEVTALLLHDLEDIRRHVLFFWQRYGLETVHGGFHGTLDRNGSPVDPTAKGLVQQARHVW